jgi:hypothetical protein
MNLTPKDLQMSMYKELAPVRLADIIWLSTCKTLPSGMEDVMKTAQLVRQLGIYASDCCINEVLFDVNDRYSRCPKCSRLCGWEFVEKVFSWHEMDDLESIAA